MSDDKDRPYPVTHESRSPSAPDAGHDGSEPKKNERSTGAENSRAGVIEKAFTVFSILLLVCTVGLLLAETFQEDKPPAFSIEALKPAQSGDLIAVSVIIHNTGDETAKAVQVRAEVPVGEGERIEAEASLDWLPGGSKRRVTLLFPPKTKLDSMKVMIVGYEVP